MEPPGNLWDCGNCGTRGIAAGLTFCPNCRKDREVAAVNAAGHVTVSGEPNDAQRMAQAVVGISPPKKSEVTEPVLSDITGSDMINPDVEPEDVTPEVSETGSDPVVQASEKASLAKEAFSSGDKPTAIALLDEAIALDPSRSDKWTKLKDQVVGSGEQW